MAKIHLSVVQILRNTATSLEKSTAYQWGHMGSCNCGFLAQEITHLRKDEIHARAMQHHGDWNEQLNDYCLSTGLPMESIIDEMIAAGFNIDDLRHLEKLSDPEILQTLKIEERNLRHNVKADVVRYINAWAGLLESRLTDTVQLPSLIQIYVTESA